MIEVKVVEGEAPVAPEYPKLMVGKHTGAVVLLSGPSEGVVVGVGTTPHKIGYCSAWFDMRSLEPFTGTVTLRNK